MDAENQNFLPEHNLGKKKYETEYVRLTSSLQRFLYEQACRFIFYHNLYFFRSSRAMLLLACLSSTLATPSWAAASWVCLMQWPTLASPSLCKFYFSVKKQGFGAGAEAKITSKTFAHLKETLNIIFWCSKWRKTAELAGCHPQSTTLRKGVVFCCQGYRVIADFVLQCSVCMLQNVLFPLTLSEHEYMRSTCHQMAVTC